MSNQKVEIIINPNTQRPVRIGSRTWNNLVKQGVLEDNQNDSNIIEDNFKELSGAEFNQKIKDINEKLPVGTQAVRGRGKYANKIVKRSKPLSQLEITKSTVKKASKIAAKHIDEFDDSDYNDIEQRRLEKLIMDEMINTNKLPQKTTLKTNKKKPIEVEVEYENEDEDEDEGDEDEHDEEEY